MKLGVTIGDKALVLTGKFKGKTANVVAIDKKTARVRLEGLKISKAGDKKLHGTFHRTSLQIIKPEVKAEEASA